MAQESTAFATELKFVVDRGLADGIREWCRRELAADPYAVGGGDGYQTTTLYFDTEFFDQFFRRRSYGRAKFRVRRYNNSDIVFLERKMKFEGRVSKRRSHCELAELSRFEGPSSEWLGRWFARRIEHRRLYPVCQIEYDRTARVGMSSLGPIRLTLDTGLRAAPIDAVRFKDVEMPEILPQHAVLEMKYRVHVPAVFKRLIEEFSLTPKTFSKYRAAVKALRLVSEKEKLALGV